MSRRAAVTLAPTTATAATGRYRTSVARLVDRSGSQALRPRHEAAEDHAERERHRREDQDRQPARADEVEVRVLVAQRVDGGAEHDEEAGAEGEPTEPTRREQAADDEVDRRREHADEDPGEQDEEDRPADGDLADDLLGLGDPALGLVARRHRQQPHGEALRRSPTTVMPDVIPAASSSAQYQA